MEEQAAREAQASAEEHRRRLANRQRLRELRIKRLRAKVKLLDFVFVGRSLIVDVFVTGTD